MVYMKDVALWTLRELSVFFNDTGFGKRMTRYRSTYKKNTILQGFGGQLTKVLKTYPWEELRYVFAAAPEPQDIKDIVTRAGGLLSVQRLGMRGDSYRRYIAPIVQDGTPVFRRRRV